MFPFDKLDKLEDLAFLDQVVTPLANVVNGVIRPAGLRDVLHGTWLGHPLHAVLVQVPIGSFVSASLLDLLPGDLPGDERSADLLAGIGLASAVPAALSGATDWSKSNPSTQRSGLVHALLNTVGLALWTGSVVARVRGRRGAATRLGLLGTSVIGVSGTIGGHLAYRKGLGADSQSDIADIASTGWVDVGSDDLPEGKPVMRDADGTPLVLVREGKTIHALADRCTHQAGPLHEGTLEDGCLTCPWHGSSFRISDGSVVHGPSVHPQPAFDVRRKSGRLEAKLRS